MSEYKDFTSLPPEKERHFVVYEKSSREVLKKARIIGIVAGGLFGLLVVAIAFSHEPPADGHLMAGDDMGNLARKDEEKTKAAVPDAPTAGTADEGGKETDEAVTDEAVPDEASDSADDKAADSDPGE